MPFSLAHFPNLALGLLKPAAEAAGFDCDVRYFSLDHLNSVGAHAHAMLTDVRLYNAQIGEWVFAGVANATPDAPDESFLTDLLATDFAEFYTPDRLLAFITARAGAEAFIETCYRSIDWSRLRVVGFTSSFQQTMASLALARRIRREHPDIFIVFGGANCQDEMGAELHRQYNFIDAVCQGEGDRAFPELLRRLAAGEPLSGIAGMVVREAGHTIVPSASTDSIADLDTLPIPDFDAFFQQHAALHLTDSHPPAIVFETARGCWWGAKQHCTFCGLNGVTMGYRAKSQARAYDELVHLVTRHGTTDVANADNILEMRYFDEFIPRLAESGLDLRIFYETKSNLKPWHWSALGRAGIRKVQAGIESLDTDVLKLMRKGVSGIQNVAALKLAAEAGVYVEWLNLCGFPGETASSYDALAALIPRLLHLQPPAAFYRARADRFSPYQRDPGQFGVTLEPLRAYQHLFPFDDASIARLAYHFTMRSDALDRTATITEAAEQRTAEWRLHHEASALWLDREDDTIVVHDERWHFQPTIRRYNGAEAALLDLCWQPTPWRIVHATLDIEPVQLQTAARELDAAGLILCEGEHLLALPLRQPGHRRAPSWPELRANILRPFADTGAMERAA